MRTAFTMCILPESLGRPFYLLRIYFLCELAALLRLSLCA